MNNIETMISYHNTCRGVTLNKRLITSTFFTKMTSRAPRRTGETLQQVKRTEIRIFKCQISERDIFLVMSIFMSQTDK